MEQIKMCPYCKNTDGLEVIMIGMFYHVLCACGANGPGSTAHIDAVLLWNAAANQIEVLHETIRKRDVEIEGMRKVVRDTDAERHKAYVNWQVALQRQESADKRQDELEAEIEQLLDERDRWAERCYEARAWARKYYKYLNTLRGSCIP